MSGISDYEIVFINSYISAKIQQPIQRKILIWNKANLENVRLNASNLALDFMNSYDVDTAVEILWERFKSICNACLDLIPCKLSSTRFNQPWITRNIKSLSRKKQRSYNQARALNTSEAWVKYKELKWLTQQECHKAYNHFIANLTDVNKPGSSKKFWSFIKSKRKDQCEVPPLVCNGATHTDDLTKANVLYNQFTSVFTNERTSYIPKPQGTPYPTIQSIQIHQDGVIQLMQQLDYSKAYGPDKIPGRLLKETAVELSSPLTLIFQASLKQGQLTEDWKHAILPQFLRKEYNHPLLIIGLYPLLVYVVKYWNILSVLLSMYTMMKTRY